MQRLLGYGLGSAGPVLYQHYPDALGTPQQIVQNEYASLLLEYGLLGLALIIIVLVTLFKTIKITSPPQLSWLLTLLFAYALTLWFFSGLPNALHIYLLPFYAVMLSKHQPLIN